MADTYFSEETAYTDKIRMVANGDPVDGGADGPVNKALKGLANRTAYLKGEVEKLNSKEFGTSSISNKAVTSQKLADEAVTAEKIASGAVTAEKIADNAITGAKLADGAINSAKIDMNDLQKALTDNSGGESGGSGASFMVSGIAAAPNYYERSECYKAKGNSVAADRHTIKTPASLWLNVNNAGYGLTASKELDLSKDATWSANAQQWQANHTYKVDDVVYPLSGKTSYYYRCITEGTSSSLEPTFPTELGKKYNDGNCQWVCELDYTLTSNRAGKDFYIFIGVNADKSLKTCISANSTAPYGYTATTSRKVGGFHCLCADVGTIAGHTLNGYVAGDILPASVWDLNHRPKSEPEGMVYIDGLDMWVDIYLCSWSGSTAEKNLKTISKYGAVTGDGASAEKFHPLKWEQTMGEQKKRLPWVREFRIFSVGSNQSTNIKGSTDANTTGGHMDTAGRRMISNYGIEDCCGFLWQWCADVGYAITVSSSYSNGFDVNDRSDVKGRIYGGEYRPLVGGDWNNGAVCGSRAANWSYGSLCLNALYGARGASEPMGRNA